jgi:hypothetical protein
MNLNIKLIQSYKYVYRGSMYMYLYYVKKDTVRKVVVIVFLH